MKMAASSAAVAKVPADCWAQLEPGSRRAGSARSPSSGLAIADFLD